MWGNGVQSGGGRGIGEGGECDDVLVSRKDPRQMDDDWSDVRRNIMSVRSVWERMETLVRQEGADPRVVAMFYRAVVQAVLLYGSETWVLLAEM